MFTKSYEQTIDYLASIAPDLANPTKFIVWVEDISDMLEFIYSVDYDTVTVDLTEAAKEYQDE